MQFTMNCRRVDTVLPRRLQGSNWQTTVNFGSDSDDQRLGLGRSAEFAETDTFDVDWPAEPIQLATQ